MYDDEEDEENKGPPGTFEIYNAEGEMLYRRGLYMKAISSFSIAIDKQEERDIRDVLVARSRCYLALGDMENALKDAEESLKETQKYHRGLYQKAECLYIKGEFEAALMFYYRGHRIRPELKEFTLGITKCQEAIINAVGDPKKVKLTKEGDLSFFEAQKEENKPKIQPKRLLLNQTQVKKKVEEMPKSVVGDKTVRTLLGELYGDRLFLEKLLNDADSTETGKKIHSLALEGIRYLDKRTEFWRQQKPMYARRAFKAIKGLSGPGMGLQGHILQVVQEMETSLKEENCDDVINLGKRCVTFLQRARPQTIGNRETILAKVYWLMGKAHMELGSLDEALSFFRRELKLGEEHDMPESISRGKGHMGRVYARKGNYKQAVQCWQSKMPLAKDHAERAWLNHDIGRCYLALGDFEFARKFGEKAILEAIAGEDEQWELNATVLVAQCESKQREYAAAFDSFERALAIARLIGDEAAERAIIRAIEDVERMQDLNKEEQALNAMQEALAGEASDDPNSK